MCACECGIHLPYDMSPNPKQSALLYMVRAGRQRNNVCRVCMYVRIVRGVRSEAKGREGR